MSTIIIWDENEEYYHLLELEKWTSRVARKMVDFDYFDRDLIISDYLI